MTALRVLIAMMHLKRTVEVGFVIGVIEKITPIGSATSARLRSGNSRIMPTASFILYVVVDELRGHHVLDDLVFHHSELGFLNRQAGESIELVPGPPGPSP